MTRIAVLGSGHIVAMPALSSAAQSGSTLAAGSMALGLAGSQMKSVATDRISGVA